MSEFVIVADSSSDLPQDIIQKFNIDLVPFSVSLDSENYHQENVEITTGEFYEKLITTNCFPKTSLPSIQNYLDHFKVHLDAGKDIICFCLSSMLSGSYQSAFNAKNILQDEYPDRKIEVMDTLQATAGEGLIVYNACLMKEDGFDYPTIIETCLALRETAKINFTVDSLEYLQKGGRIGKASALAGTLLNIKPVLVMSDGELTPAAKVRGKKKAIKEMIDITLNDITNIDDYFISIICATRPEDVATIKKELLELVPNAEFVFDGIIGVTIGAHAGPTAIGIAYIKKYSRI